MIYFLKISNHEPINSQFLTKNKVSIAIVFKDELENLKENIPYFLKQEKVDVELVLINDHSKDGSVHWLEELKHPSIKVFSLEQESGKKKGLELAFQKMENETVLLTDADCMPSSKLWAYKMSSLISKDKQIVLGYSRLKKELGLLNLIQRYENFLNGIQYLSYAIKGQAYMGTGRNMAYTKSLRSRIDFPENYFKIKSGDDDLFVNAIEEKNTFEVAVSSELQTISAGADSWGKYFHQKRRHLEAGTQYKIIDRLKLAVFGTSQLLLNIAFVILLVLGMYSKLILSIFVLKLIIQSIIYFKLTKKLNEKGLLFWVWIIEPLYLLLISIVGISVWLKKVDRWK